MRYTYQFSRTYVRLVIVSCLSFLLVARYVFTNKATTQLPILAADLGQLHVSFDDSMQIDKYRSVLSSHWGPEMIAFFQQLYEKNNFLQVIAEKQTKIPKIIHQIWLGSPFPEKYKKFQESWKKHHPNWVYRLWTDKDIPAFKLQNQRLYDKATNYGEKSDILRYEILYRYGGLYIDTDFECLHPLDILHHCYDFYIGIQPLDTNIVQLGIGLIGVVPKHGLLKKAIESLPKHAHIPQIIAKTGPLFFTKLFFENSLQVPGLTIALPSTYFYPCGYTQDPKKAALWQRPESFAIHHWEGSWLKKEAFEQR